MTLDNPNFINYGMNNLQADYRYYQSMASDEQQHHQQQLKNKSYRSPAYDNNKRQYHQPQTQPQPQPQLIKQTQYHRPERPKTLDTQTTSLHSSLKPTPVSYLTQSSITNNSQVKNATVTPSNEDDGNKIENKTNKTVKYSMSLDSTESKNIANSMQSSALSPFDEQEEWKKISEIMANFGTDLIHDADTIQNDATALSNLNANRRRDHQNRVENGRSNSIAGFSFAELSRQNNSNENTHRHSMKYSESLNNAAKRRSQSPHSLLRNFLYSHELEPLSSILYDSGYDDIEFIKGILSDSDLETFEINVENRKKLLAAVENDLQKPARAITTLTKPASNAKSNVYHSMSTNNDKVQQFNSNNNDYASNSNNNNYSTIPKQKNQNNFDGCNGTLSVDEWLTSIKLPQYSEVFK